MASSKLALPVWAPPSGPFLPVTDSQARLSLLILYLPGQFDTGTDSGTGLKREKKFLQIEVIAVVI